MLSIVALLFQIFPLSAVGLEVLLNPRHCICLNQNYTCDVRSGIGLAWLTNTTSPDDLEHSTSETDDEQYIERGGFQVAFQRIKTNEYNSTLHVRDLGLNQTTLTCEGSAIVDLSTFETTTKTDTISICISGNITLYYLAAVVTHKQVQPHLPLVCQWCVSPHQQWSVSSLQCMEESVWSTMWSLLSVKRGMSHAMSAVEKTVSTAAFLSREMPMTTSSVSMV